VVLGGAGGNVWTTDHPSNRPFASREGEEDRMQNNISPRKGLPFLTTVQIRRRWYFVSSRIAPAVEAPHVGADSPRWCEPGKPAEVLSMQVSRPYADQDYAEYSEEEFNDHQWATVKEAVLEHYRVSEWITGETA
jgi:hypothetical protein